MKSKKIGQPLGLGRVSAITSCLQADHYRLWILLGILSLATILFSACQEGHKTIEYHSISGETMGTYYRIVSKGVVSKQSIEHLLMEVNQQVNTYDSTSVISQFNQMEGGDTLWLQTQAAFVDNLRASQALVPATAGYFNPCVGPLVRHWGFDEDRLRDERQEQDILDLLKVSRWEELHILEQGDSVKAVAKKYDQQRLDFNAIAKGYAVDRIGGLLEAQGIQDYQVDIGGEVLVRGVSPRQKAWVLAINSPSPDSKLEDSHAMIEIPLGAVATSGNYRNYYKNKDSVVVHTINPHTGRYEINSLLSATVWSPNCQQADALATACMSAGLAQCLEIIGGISSAEAYLIYKDDDYMVRDTMTREMYKMIIK